MAIDGGRDESHLTGHGGHLDVIDAVASGRIAVEASALRAAPHTAAVATADAWDRAYTRTEAAWPAGVGAAKYWPPVGRIDNVYGDRNLICSCPPPEAYQIAAE